MLELLLTVNQLTSVAVDEQKVEGYPSGLVVDFACDIDGSPILAVSSLATHAKVCFLTSMLLSCVQLGKSFINYRNE